MPRPAGPAMARALSFGLSLLLATFACFAAFAAPPAERQKELIHRLKHDCGSCHGMTLKGGLGPALLPTAIADKPNEVLVDVILYGLPGTPMPPWGFEIAPEEAAWLARRLKEGLPDGN